MISDSNSYRKNERAARAIERRLGLDAPKPRALDDRQPRASGVRAERGRCRFERLNASLSPADQPPQKGTLKVIDPHQIFDSIDEAKDLDDLRERLRKKGLESKYAQSPGSDEPTGWSLRQAGPAGVWIKGSDVDRALSLKKVRERMLENSKKRQKLSALDQRSDDSPARRLHQSGGSFMSVLVGLSFVVAIRLVSGLINLIGRVLARRAQVPAQGLGMIDVDEDGTPTLIEPVDLPTDATAEQHARLDAARLVMSEVLDQATEAIQQDDTSRLPTLTDPEVVAARAKVIKQLDEMEEDDDQDNTPQFERERPR